MMKRLLCLVVVATAMLGPASVAFAAPGFQLQGGATPDSGDVRLVSNTADTSTTNNFSAINFTNLADAGVTTFSSLSMLAADFNVTDDDCGGGSPRFQLNVGGKNVFVYLGPAPNFTGCPTNTWVSSGNLIGSTDARYDLSQLFPGTQNSTYAQALALIGSQAVTGIQLVVDSSWKFADLEQTVLVDNVKINTATFTFTEDEEGPGEPRDADACKNGGWRDFTDPEFKNQGQCVSHFVSNRDHDKHDNDDDDEDEDEDGS